MKQRTTRLEEVNMMQSNQEFGKLASDGQIEKTVKALEENGFRVEVLEKSEEAGAKVIKLLPKGAEVFTMSSRTLETVGIEKEVNQSGRYNAVRPRLLAMDRTTQGREMARLGAAPDFVVSSVQAVTQDGHLLIASNTGSQLSAEVYAGGAVIFVVGTQKIVKDDSEALRRIYEYSYPLEDERARKVYGVGSGVNKILIINKEVKPERITVILVKEKLGF